MGKDILTVGDNEIETNKFYHHKTPIFSKDVDIEKLLVSNKIFYLMKKSIGYLYNNNKVKPLQIMLPNTKAYVKSNNGQTKWTCFLIEDDE